MYGDGDLGTVADNFAVHRFGGEEHGGAGTAGDVGQWKTIPAGTEG